MPKETVEVLIEGGKATAAPPLGPALGPLGVNIGQIVAEINNKTADYKGMQVPVKVIVDTETKKFEITIGTPPASALIKKEANIPKGAANPKEKTGELTMEQVIKITKMKLDSLGTKDLKNGAKQILGTCNSMGVFIDNKRGKEVAKEIDDGIYDVVFNK